MVVTEPIKDWVYRKVSKLDRYAPRVVESHVILKKEKYFFVAEITLLASHLRAYGEGKDKGNLYTAIDWACERMAKQLKKFREKVKSHHQLERKQLSRKKREGAKE